VVQVKKSIKIKSIWLAFSVLLITSTSIGVSIYFNNCQDCSVNNKPNSTDSIWDEISFSLINSSLVSISDFHGKNLLLEISSSKCPDCIQQIPVIKQFISSPYFNDSLVILTLFTDLSSQSELLDFYIDNNLSWLVGSINTSNLSKLGLTYVPAFYLFDSSGSEIDSIQNFVSNDALLDFLGFISLPLKGLGSEIYHTHKKQINSLQETDYSLISQSHLFIDSYIIGDSRNFYCLDTSTTYRTLFAQVVNVSSHAYFFVEQGIITALGLEMVRDRISSEVTLFENNIHPVESAVFGDIEGLLGNIGDGKIIVLYASLPSGWAGYFDPYNEYSQESIGSYLSNEWEMIYLDYSDSFESTLAHEFQHLIHFNHDPNEATWFDEGCSELAAFLSGCFPSEWNNLTFFANLFRFSYDDSLIFWNFFSSNGRDVRIDYGGAYLFLLYFYEQFNSSAVSFVVSDTSPTVTSIHSFLSSFNMTFNDFFLNWQIALFLDDSEQYGFSNIDSSLNPLFIIDSEEYNQFSIPYYGFYGISFDLTSSRYEISIANPTTKKMSLTLFHYSNELFTGFEIFISSNFTFSFLPSENTTRILLVLSYIDENFPLTSSGIGLGSFTYISISTFNPFQLVTSTPTIEQNSTHLLVYALNIFFINNPLMIVNSSTSILTISINISLFPSNILEILEQITVTAFIFNSSKQLYLTSELLSNNYFVWSIQFDFSDFLSTDYYTVIYLTYQNQEFHSFPSKMINISPVEPSKTNFFFLPVIVILFIFRKFIYNYHFSRRYIYENQ